MNNILPFRAIGKRIGHGDKEAARAFMRALALFQPPGVTGPRERENIRLLAEAGALVEAAFAVLALELPQWTVSRIDREDGEWYCTLEVSPGYAGSGGHVVACHGALSLAILEAVVEASRVPRAFESASASLSDQTAVCCENYR
jgi:hypothetical protein